MKATLSLRLTISTSNGSLSTTTVDAGLAAAGAPAAESFMYHR